MYGALMTFDRGPKSSGLALMVELFANALTEGCLPRSIFGKFALGFQMVICN